MVYVVRVTQCMPDTRTYTPKKKSDRPSVCSTNLGFSVGYELCTYQVLCTYVPGISRQKYVPPVDAHV